MCKTRERLVKLILSAVMIALSIAMTRLLPQEMVLALFGQTPLTVRLGLGLIPVYFASMALGPGWGAAVGGLADLLGYFVNPFGGAFFLPITLAAELTAAIPGLVTGRFGRGFGSGARAVYAAGFSSCVITTFLLEILLSTPFFVLFWPRLVSMLIMNAVYVAVEYALLRAFGAMGALQKLRPLSKS